MTKKVLIEIELGNNAMTSFVHVAGALASLSVKVRQSRNMNHQIKDINGNTVGWMKEEHQ